MIKIYKKALKKRFKIFKKVELKQLKKKFNKMYMNTDKLPT